MGPPQAGMAGPEGASSGSTFSTFFFFKLMLIYTFVLLLAPRYERGEARTMIKM